jgi:cytochrome c553
MNKMMTLALSILFSGSLLSADITKGKEKSAICIACHAIDGNSQIKLNPKLAGQSEKYLIKQLLDFKKGKRLDPTMQSMASLLSTQDIQNIAAYFSSQTVQHQTVDKQYIALAERIYRGGDKNRDIPACIACHSATGKGLSSAGFPAIGGQHPAYTIKTLKAFRSGKRNNDANEIMQDVVSKMSDKQIEALAYYLAGLH